MHRWRIEVDGRACLLTWHEPDGDAPEGTPHGSAAICVTARGNVLLVSSDGSDWQLPAGRPEAGETWRETLDREVREEACAAVSKARLLGYCQSHCQEGMEADLVLVRAFWRTEVVLEPWQPQFEMKFRREERGLAAFQALSPTFECLNRHVLGLAGVL
ncbi:MAG TPA: NUDIX domain-containing protein [Fimbriimonadaceae bacterium]|nr:NUDIX domain-containing protein [Fimbriimonadaceae bacterium]